MRDDYITVASTRKSRVVIANFSGGADYDTDESVSEIARASDSYNFDFSGGELRTGYGLSEYADLSKIAVESMWLFTRYDPEKSCRDDIMLVTDKSGKLYEKHVADGGEFAIVDGVIFTEKPTYINYRLYGDDVVIMCSGKDGMFVYDGKNAVTRVDNAPMVTSMALHSERLFVTVSGEKKDLWFSEDLDPTNWDASLTGGGFIQMTDERGDLTRVISFLGYVYVFREHGISRVYASGSQTDFAVTNLFVSGGKIYSGSVTVCGDRVLFLASDGLYSFDGVSTSRILKKVSGVIKNGENCSAIYHDGKYYLSFYGGSGSESIGSEKSGTSKNNMMLVFETETGKYALSRGVDIACFSASDETGVIAITEDGRAGSVCKCGEYFGAPLKKVWNVPKTDMGNSDKKTVREIRLYTKTAVTVTLKSDTNSKAIYFNGGRDVQRKRVSFSGRRIGLEIACESSEAKISRPSLIITHGGF